MTNFQEYAYWMSFAHLPRWNTARINRLIVNILDERKITFSDFFEVEKNDLLNEFDLSYKEADDIEQAKLELPNHSFLVEDLINQGFDLIPINSKEYSTILKNNLKTKFSPPLLYVKGNKDLLNETSIAIVGSRKANKKSLEFTKNVAQKAVNNYEVVISGFAKGVDRTALEETLAVNGRSIIVLPQGIMTFESGFKKYYSQLIDGDILVVSTYHPKVPWSVGLAMGRNVYIYGLAEKIFVAESDSKGGTWSGVIDGLKKDREIYVRVADTEDNANNKLIMMGATPVDSNGDIQHHEELDNLERNLKNILKSPLSAKEIQEKIQTNMGTPQLSKMLSQLPYIKTEKTSRGNIFSLKSEEVVQIKIF